MAEEVENWRALSGKERADLQEALAAEHHDRAGGSLHVDEMHVVIDGRVYRYFLPVSEPDAKFEADTEVEVCWWTKKTKDFPGELTRVQRQIHFDICRDGDKFAGAIARIDMDPIMRAELVTQVVAMQRVAMVANSPGRALSNSKLNRF